MITFRYTTPWIAHYQCSTPSEKKWLKSLFSFVDYTDTYHKQRFKFFPTIQYLDTVNMSMSHGQVIYAYQQALAQGIECQFDNWIPRLTIETGPIPEDFLPGIKIRDYQRLAIQVLAGYGYGLGIGGTGMGKTVVMGGLVKVLVEQTDCPCIMIMIYSKDLLNQTARRLNSYGVPMGDIGIVHSDIPAEKQVTESQKRVVLTTHRSIAKHHVAVNKCEYVICDEAHEVMGDLWTKMLQAMPNLKNVIGLTATPWDNENEKQKMVQVFGQTLFDVPIPFLVKRGYLMNPEVYMIRLNYRDRDIASCRNMSWQQAKKVFCIEDQNRNLMPLVLLKIIGGRMLIIYDDLVHGKLLHDLYKEHGIDVRLADGSTSTKHRDACIKWFQTDCEEGQIGKVMIASRIFNQGIDLDGGCDILCPIGAKAKRRIAKQRIGRSLRLNRSGKLYIFDMWDSNHETLSRWSSARRDVFEELGFTPKIIKPEDIGNLFATNTTSHQPPA